MRTRIPRWAIAAGVSIALNTETIALALLPSQWPERVVNLVMMPGIQFAHYVGFNGGEPEILSALAVSLTFYFVFFWICLRIFDYVVRRQRHRRDTF